MATKGPSPVRTTFRTRTTKSGRTVTTVHTKGLKKAGMVNSGMARSE